MIWGCLRGMAMEVGSTILQVTPPRGKYRFTALGDEQVSFFWRSFRWVTTNHPKKVSKRNARQMSHFDFHCSKICDYDNNLTSSMTINAWRFFATLWSSSWRIIPVGKWLVTLIYKPFRPFGRETTPLRGLANFGY